MNDSWWAIGQTLRAREQDIRTLFERVYLREVGAGGRRKTPRFRSRLARLGPACACNAACC